jgi:hypothetical protein
MPSSPQRKGSKAVDGELKTLQALLKQTKDKHKDDLRELTTIIESQHKKLKLLKLELFCAREREEFIKKQRDDNHARALSAEKSLQKELERKEGRRRPKHRK